MFNRVEGLPGDEHCHDSSLAGSSRHLQCPAFESGVGIVAGVSQAIEYVPSCSPLIWCDFGQPYDRFECFDLAEEWPLSVEVVGTPMLQQLAGSVCDTPIVWIGQFAPLVDMQADIVDALCRLVLLPFVGELLGVFNDQAGLCGTGLISRWWDWSYEA